MAPSRIYVALFVFGLIATLSISAYVVLLAAGFRPAWLAGLVPDEVPPGDILFLTVSAAFCLGFTLLAWRTLVAGARRDRERRAILEEARRRAR